MIPLAIGIALLTGTIALGLLTMSAVDRGRDLFKVADPDKRGHAHGQRSFIRWEPLQLAPHRVPWPSEVTHQVHQLPPLYWPSERWDDPQFGPIAKRRAVDTKVTLTGNEPLSSSRTRPQPRAEAAQAEQAFFAEEHRDKARKPHMAQQQQTLQQRMADVALHQAKLGRPGPPTAGAKPVGHGDLPDAATLAEWVNDVGLAGAVGRLRSHTGWDFQRAARYLAQQVSGGGR